MTKSRLGVCCIIAALGVTGISALKRDHSMETIRAACDELGRCWETGSGSASAQHRVTGKIRIRVMSFMRREIGPSKAFARAGKRKETAKHRQTD
jgi:hypothetical protein